MLEGIWGYASNIWSSGHESIAQPEDMGYISPMHHNVTGHRSSNLQGPECKRYSSCHEHKESSSNRNRIGKARTFNESKSESLERAIQHDVDNCSRRMISERYHECNRTLQNIKSKHEDNRLNVMFLEAKNEDLFLENRELDTKCNALKTQLDKVKENGLELHAQQQYEHSRFKYISKSIFGPYAKSKHLRYDAAVERDVQNVGSLLLNNAVEADTLRAQNSTLTEQVNSLQKELFSHVEKVDSVTDEQFASEFRALASLVKSFSRSIKVPEQPNILDFDFMKCSLLVMMADQKHWEPRSHKKYLIEAFVWSTLYMEVYSSPFLFGGSYYDNLPHAFIDLFRQGHQHFWPIPTQRSEQWRYMTVEHIVKDFESKDPEIEASIEEARRYTANVIVEPLSRVCSNLDVEKLLSVVVKAFELSLKMAQQRYRVQVVFPKVGDPFGPSEGHMTTDEEVEQGAVAFVIRPGLAKWGDMYGENLDQRLDLVPALVFVEEKPKVEIVID